MIYKPRNMILYNYDVPTLKYFDPETGTQKVFQGDGGEGGGKEKYRLY